MDAIASTITSSIRVDATTKKGSVIDVIRMVNREVPSNQASMVFSRLATEYPELSSKFDRVRINGKGRLTPVADFQTLIRIIFELPGTTARQFRRRCAVQVCRLIGGDLRIIDEVEQRNQWWQQSAKRRRVQEALIAPIDSDEDIAAKPTKTQESSVRDELAAALQGKTEVQTPAGAADVVTATEVIEVKHYTNWKHAIGQVLAYGTFLPHLTRRIHLFADAGDKAAASIATMLAASVCGPLNIAVTLMVFGDDQWQYLTM